MSSAGYASFPHADDVGANQQATRQALDAAHAAGRDVHAILDILIDLFAAPPTTGTDPDSVARLLGLAQSRLGDETASLGELETLIARVSP